jgi:ABC-2 type transport system ATP-binding protein
MMPSNRPDCEPESEPPMTAPLLDVIDLHKRYGQTIALGGVSFQVAEGEMFGLLGPNGAGKTTLLSILSCLLAPSAGEAYILGTRVRAHDRELRRQIGIVPQELAVYGELSGRENLRFFGELYGESGPPLRQRVGEVLAAVGLEEHADRRVDTYSGGMKRRLNLGVALLHRPRLLLLDEPTTGVDPQSRNHIFEEVRRLNAAGVTVVYTSHSMEEVQALCTRIGIMDHGRLIACDTLPALLQQLEGLIRIRVPHVTPMLRDRVKQLPDMRLTERDTRALELECRDVKSTLLRLLAVLNELHVELTHLETEEPNLERVFLHLTGRALRD